jgi:hypothetical protein
MLAGGVSPARTATMRSYGEMLRIVHQQLGVVQRGLELGEWHST